MWKLCNFLTVVYAKHVLIWKDLEELDFSKWDVLKNHVWIHGNWKLKKTNPITKSWAEMSGPEYILIVWQNCTIVKNVTIVQIKGIMWWNIFLYSIINEYHVPENFLWIFLIYTIIQRQLLIFFVRNFIYLIEESSKM